MVPPPPASKAYTSIKGPHHPKTPGERKNFFEQQRAHKHLYPIGTIVMVKTPSMRAPAGPGKVTEQCPPVYPGGPPQYVIVPVSDNSRFGSQWYLFNERYVYEATPEDLEAAAARPRRFNYQAESDDDDSDTSDDDEERAEFYRIGEHHAVVQGNAIVYDNEIELV